MKKVVSDSLGLVDFGIGLVNPVRTLPSLSVFTGCPLRPKKTQHLLHRPNLPDGHEIFFFLHIKKFLGLVEMMFMLVNASFSLPKWQAVKMTFFAPCIQLVGNMHISSVRSGSLLCWVIVGADPGGGCRGCAPPPPEMTCGFLIQRVFCPKNTMWVIGVEVV